MAKPEPPVVIMFGRPLSSLAKPLIGSAKSQKYLKVCSCVKSRRSSNGIISTVLFGTNPTSGGGASISFGLLHETTTLITEIVIKNK